LSCALGGASTVASFQQALDELKEGKVLPAISDLSDALGAINPAVKNCKEAETEVESLVGGLKSLTPAKAIERVKSRHSDILENVAQASKCHDTGDYTGMGTQVGSLLRKIVEEDGFMLAAAPVNTTVTTTMITTTTTMPTKHGEEFVEGLVMGLLSDGNEALSCALGGAATVASFQQALTELKDGKILPAINDLAGGLAAINPAVKNCETAEAQVKSLVGGLKSLTPASAVAHVKAHHSEILENVAQASKCQDNDDYTGMGTQVGSLIRKIVEEDVVV